MSNIVSWIVDSVGTIFSGLGTWGILGYILLTAFLLKAVQRIVKRFFKIK